MDITLPLNETGIYALIVLLQYLCDPKSRTEFRARGVNKDIFCHCKMLNDIDRHHFATKQDVASTHTIYCERRDVSQNILWNYRDIFLQLQGEEFHRMGCFTTLSIAYHNFCPKKKAGFLSMWLIRYSRPNPGDKLHETNTTPKASAKY